jgi:acylphosphatase
MSAEALRVRAIVSGRVQAVGYRAFAQRHARNAGVRGTVRNLPDGTVECIIEGDADAVERVLQLLRQGPPMARVEDVDVQQQQPGGDLPAMTVTA